MSKDALQLGPKENLSLMQTVIKRLDAHAIARKNKPALRLNPQTDGKHSPESLEARIAPMQKGIENYFGVTARVKAIACSLKLGAQLLMIEDLAVKNENHISIRALQRLVASAQVQDPQARCPERNLFRFELSLVVWTAVNN